MVSNEKIEKAGFVPNISLEMGLRELLSSFQCLVRNFIQIFK
jgi:hypothetical protein